LKGEAQIHTYLSRQQQKGFLLLRLIADLGKTKEQERIEKIGVVKEGLTRAGHGLAELHLKSKAIKAPIAEDVQKQQLSFFSEEFGVVKDPELRGSGLGLPDLNF